MTTAVASLDSRPRWYYRYVAWEKIEEERWYPGLSRTALSENAESLETCAATGQMVRSNTPTLFHGAKLIASPPEWTDKYYDRGKKQRRFDQIIDVPFFGDSQEVLLLQVADLIAYLLRHQAELEEGLDKDRYAGESDAVRDWIRKITARALPAATRWPKKSRGNEDGFFSSLAPVPLLKVGDLAPGRGGTQRATEHDLG